MIKISIWRVHKCRVHYITHHIQNQNQIEYLQNILPAPPTWIRTYSDSLQTKNSPKWASAIIVSNDWCVTMKDLCGGGRRGPGPTGPPGPSSPGGGLIGPIGPIGPIRGPIGGRRGPNMPNGGGGPNRGRIIMWRGGNPPRPPKPPRPMLKVDVVSQMTSSEK